MDFSMSEYWSRLPFPTPGNLPKPGIEPMSLASPALAGRFLIVCHLGSLLTICMSVCSVTSVVSNSVWPCGLQPASLLCPWNSPGKNTEVGCYALLKGIFPIQESNLQSLISSCIGRWVFFFFFFTASTTWEAPLTIFFKTILPIHSMFLIECSLFMNCLFGVCTINFTNSLMTDFGDSMVLLLIFLDFWHPKY